MTKEQLAQELNGCQYTSEMHHKAAKDSNPVVVYGCFDDRMEFSGAVYDEEDCFGGGIAYLDENGLWENKCDEGDNCPCPLAERAKCKTIAAIWHDECNPCWIY